MAPDNMSVGSALLSARRIIEAFDIPRGAHVADFATGRTGHFVFPLAEVVGDEGRVYAVDILPDVLAVLESMRAERAKHHVHVVWGDVERPSGVRIPEATLDFAFLVHAFTSLREWETAAAEVQRLMRPGGRVIVVDWHPNCAHTVARMTQRTAAPHELDLVFRAKGMRKHGEFAPSSWHWGRVYAS